MTLTFLTKPIAFALFLSIGLFTASTLAAKERLECRIVGAQTEYRIRGGFRCRKTVKQAKKPSCTDGRNYSLRNGPDKCVKPIENYPPRGGLIAVPTYPVVCLHTGGPSWTLVTDAVGAQDQCQRTVVTYVAPGVPYYGQLTGKTRIPPRR